MEKRIWFDSLEGNLQVVKTAPTSIGLNVEVSVRPGESTLLDGVWLNGQRSFDTYVVIDGDVTYHSPDEPSGHEIFDRLEAAGWGQRL